MTAAPSPCRRALGRVATPITSVTPPRGSVRPVASTPSTLVLGDRDAHGTLSQQRQHSPRREPCGPRRARPVPAGPRAVPSAPNPTADTAVAAARASSSPAPRSRTGDALEAAAASSRSGRRRAPAVAAPRPRATDAASSVEQSRGRLVHPLDRRWQPRVRLAVQRGCDIARRERAGAAECRARVVGPAARLAEEEGEGSALLDPGEPPRHRVVVALDPRQQRRPRRAWTQCAGPTVVYRVSVVAGGRRLLLLATPAEAVTAASAPTAGPTPPGCQDARTRA